MRDAVRRHDGSCVEIERRRGYVFKTIGDAFCAAFWTIAEALGTAVEVQRRLGRENFGAVEGTPVRMAIHLGETDERSRRLFRPRRQSRGAPARRGPRRPNICSPGSPRI